MSPRYAANIAERSVLNISLGRNRSRHQIRYDYALPEVDRAHAKSSDFDLWLDYWLFVLCRMACVQAVTLDGVSDKAVADLHLADTSVRFQCLYDIDLVGDTGLHNLCCHLLAIFDSTLTLPNHCQ